MIGHLSKSSFCCEQVIMQYSTFLKILNILIFFFFLNHKHKILRNPVVVGWFCNAIFSEKFINIETITSKSWTGNTVKLFWWPYYWCTNMYIVDFQHLNLNLSMLWLYIQAIICEKIILYICIIIYILIIYIIISHIKLYIIIYMFINILQL